jgi:hypothetical protein
VRAVAQPRFTNLKTLLKGHQAAWLESAFNCSAW